MCLALKRISIIFILIAFNFSAFSQELKTIINVKGKDLNINMITPESTVTLNGSGKDIDQLKYSWKAQWITHPTESTLDYGVFLFRHVFNLESIVDEFNIFVSADNRYRLFVNGEIVSYGPSIGDTAHQRYETVDISDKLKVGENVIAAEVVNFGEHRSVSQVTYQTAFILQGDRGLDIDINTGSANWKVVKNKAFSPVIITGEMLDAYYAAGPCDRVDASEYPWGWNLLNFDDKNWLKPKSATTEFAVGRGFLYGGAWHLVPRTIPLMEERVEQFAEIARVSGMEENDAFIKGKGSILIPANSKVKILLDQTHHTTGFPELTYSKGKGSEIKITYAEALLKDVSPGEVVSDGNLMNVDLKGNRNDIEGKSIFGYYDVLLPDGGDNRFFKPLSRRTYRFIELEIKTKDEALVLEKYHGVFTGYPFIEKAKVKTGDASLDKIWDAAWRTLRNSADEMYYDAYYENLQYIGDTKIASLISIYVSGDDRLMRKAIQQFDDSRLPEGLTQSRYPSNIIQIIPPFSLIWIDMIYDYFMYRNDPEFLRQFIPGIKSVIDWFAIRVDETGMVTDLKWWNFTDWTVDFPSGNLQNQLVPGLIRLKNLPYRLQAQFVPGQFHHLQTQPVPGHPPARCRSYRHELCAWIAMRFQALTILATLLAVGCGPAGEEQDDASFQQPKRAVDDGSAAASPQKDWSSWVLSGRITKRARVAGAPIAGRRIDFEFTKFYIHCGMGMTVPYARLSVTTDRDGKFRVQVPPVPKRSSLSSARMTVTLPQAGPSDPTPPPPPPPVGSSRQGRMPEPVAAYEAVTWPLASKAIDPASPFFQLNLSSARPESGTASWMPPRWSRPRQRPKQHYDCEWGFAKRWP